VAITDTARIALGSHAPSMAARLRRGLTSPELMFLMEAHNGLSTRIVQDAGFSGIWASGLSISASLGVRDSNELSWSQVLDVLEFMVDSARIPILVDGDTGHGNFNNVRRFVRKLCQRGVAGVCIEDKVFPKLNSFIEGPGALAQIDEFCGRVKAAKDSQDDPDFCVIARVEALICGAGLPEALRRAEAYVEAGADGILIHSKRSTAEEIVAFAAEWQNRSPLVIVPTKYYSTSVDVFRAAGISAVIWANHNLRASMSAMRAVCERILRDESIAGVERGVAPLDDVFDIVDTAELLEAERRYFARSGNGAAPGAARV
jgi:phosphoenolpyruvate mutase